MLKYAPLDGGPAGMDALDKEMNDTVYENTVDVEDLTTEQYQRTERRVLWKFDIHVLPPLALVRLPALPFAAPCRLTILF